MPFIAYEQNWHGNEGFKLHLNKTDTGSN